MSHIWENERIGAISNILSIYANNDIITATDKALESAKLFLARIETGVVTPPQAVRVKFEQSTIVLNQGWESMKAIASPIMALEVLDDVGIAVKKVLMLSLAHEKQTSTNNKIGKAIASVALEFGNNRGQPQGDDDE